MEDADATSASLPRPPLHNRGATVDVQIAHTRHPTTPATEMSPLARLRPRACEVCSQTDTLTICRSCRSVWYCSEEHEASDREEHREACETIAKARKKYESEEQMLRDESAIDGRPSYFVTDAGRFGRIDETRRYLVSRLRHADLLLYYFGSTDGDYTITARVDVLETVLTDLLEMLRLSRADEVGAGIAVPSIYVALGRDQEAYDFIKWNTIADIMWDPDEWDDLERPYLDLRGEDVLEKAMDVWASRSDQMLTFVATVILIKLRILLDLIAMQNARRLLSGVLPTETIDMIRWHLAGPVLSSRPDIVRGGTEETAHLVRKLKNQALELYLAVAKSNTPFWDLMIDDDAEAVERNKKRELKPQSREEADLLARYNCTPWLMNPVALEAIRAWRERHLG